MTRRSMWQGIREWLRPAHRRAATRADVRGGGDLPAEGPGSMAGEAVLSAEFTESELLDFLAGDIDPVQADPVFRERLREELWTLVQDGAARAKTH